MSDEQTCYLADLRILAHGDNRRRHDGSRGAFLRVQPSKKIGTELFAFSEDLQPPLAPRVACRLITTDQITFAHNSYRCCIIIHDWNCANAVVKQQPSDFAYWCIRMDRYNSLGHDITCIHASGSSLIVPAVRQTS